MKAAGRAEQPAALPALPAAAVVPAEQRHHRCRLLM
jgi:hypothetical protein